MCTYRLASTQLFFSNISRNRNIWIYNICFYFLFFTFKFFKIFFNVNNRETNNELNIYLVTGFLLNLFPIPSGDFFNNWVNILIYFPVGYYLYLNEK